MFPLSIAFRKALLLLGCMFAIQVNVAFTGTSQANAIGLVTIFGLALPFLLKLVPAVGHYMVAITVAAAVLFAVGAELLSGELNLRALQTADTTALVGAIMGVYGASQFIYSLLTQSPKTQGAVTEPPVPTAPAAPQA